MQERNLTEMEATLRALGAQADAASDAADGSDTRATLQDLAQPAQADGRNPGKPGAEDGQPPAADADNENDNESTDDSDSPETGAADEQARREPEPEAALSEYEKAKRAGREREAKAWQRIEEEKTALRREREEIEAQRRAAEAERTQSRIHREAAEPARDPEGYSAQDYEEAARAFDAKGDSALADRARRQAHALRAETQQRQQHAMTEMWKRTMAGVLEQEPDLRDPQTPFGQAVKAELARDRLYHFVPDGFARAVEAVKLRRAAASVSELRKKVDGLTKENERLTKLTALSGSNPGGAPKEGRFEDLSPKEQERRLRRMAAEADSDRTA